MPTGGLFFKDWEGDCVSSSTACLEAGRSPCDPDFPAANRRIVTVPASTWNTWLGASGNTMTIRVTASNAVATAPIDARALALYCENLGFNQCPFQSCSGLCGPDTFSRVSISYTPVPDCVPSECPQGNSCQQGACSGGNCILVNLPNGTACGSQNNTDCDNPNTCNGSGTCLNNFEPSGTACTSDGNVCTDDVCNGAGACTHPNEPDGTSCDDAVFCNGIDTCSSGACASSGSPCDPTEMCCEITDDCGACCLDSDCDDAVVCTDDSCNATTKQCDFVSNDANCDDGLPCTSDTCTGLDCANALQSGCLIDGVCYTHSQENPTNPCLECNESFSTGDWSDKAYAFELCDDSSVCTYDECSQGACAHPANVYGDLNHDGVVSLFDLFCMINGFHDSFQDPSLNCTMDRIDVEPCGGNGTINMKDLYAVFNAFSDCDPCCSAPDPCAGTYGITGPGTIDLWLTAVPSSGPGGILYNVELRADNFIKLDGYEAAIIITGGTQGTLTLENLFIDQQRSDYVFQGLGSPVSAFDPGRSRMMSALDGSGVNSSGPVYLGTFALRASGAAEGNFTVSLAGGTSTLAAEVGGAEMTISVTSAAQITIGPQTGL